MEFTFLTDEQIFDNEQNKQLEILKKYGAKCTMTDFSILLGGDGWWWTKSSWQSHEYSRVAVNKEGFRRACPYLDRSCGARPVLPYSSISSICSNGVKGENGIFEVEYGEYPQTVASEDISKILEDAYSNGRTNRTGKSYTTNSVSTDDQEAPFEARTHIEYEYKGRKYIRFVADSKCSGKILSDGRMIQNGDVYWIEVEPIKWMIDKNANIALSKKIIFSGVVFDRNLFYEGNFDITDIKEFMDKYFAKDIIPSKLEEKKQSKVEKLLDEINLYLEYIPNNEIIINIINALIDEYNSKLDLLKENKNNEKYNLSLDSFESVTQNLEISLSMILDELKNDSHYFDILKYINECIDIFNGNTNDEIDTSIDDQLIKDLFVVQNLCLPFLDKKDGEKIKGDILKILNSEKTKIENYLANKFSDNKEQTENIKLNYKNKDDFVIEFRKQLHVILVELNEKAHKRATQNDVNESLNEIINDTFDLGKKRINYLFFEELNNLVLKFNELISVILDENIKVKYINRMNKIFSQEIGNDKSLDEIYAQLKDKFINLYKLILDVEDYIKYINKVNSSYISPIKK